MESGPPVNAFKRALREGRRQIGLWCALGSGTGAEILAHAGFDWILVDTEHAPNELPAVLEQLRALQGGTASPVVRPAWNDPVILKRLLDLGAQSLLIPYVQNAEEAARAVASARYPPRGIRGVASLHRANAYGARKEYLGRAHEETCVVV
jgi:4-hydroxy-2-oxoheptanedioate aldolase